MKLDLICTKDELRPAMCHVKVTKEVMVATDAHVLGVVPTNKLFSNAFIESIPDEGMLIHGDDWKKFNNCVNILWKSDDVICVIYKGSKRDALIQVENEDRVGKYPNWEVIIPSEIDRVAELNKIGIDMKLALNLQNALGLVNLSMQFTSPTKPIYVTATKKEDNPSYGIIMPVMLLDY